MKDCLLDPTNSGQFGAGVGGDENLTIKFYWPNRGCKTYASYEFYQTFHHTVGENLQPDLFSSKFQHIIDN